MSNLFDTLAQAGFKATKIDDTSREIPALNGKYVAIVTDAARNQGTSEKTGEPYDVVGFKFKIVKTIDGVSGDGRYVDKSFFLADSKWSTAVENLQESFNVIFTITNEDMGNTEADLLDGLAKCKGAYALLSIWPRKDKDTKEVVRDANGWPAHKVMVVSEVKVKGKKVNVNFDEIEKEVTGEVVPF